MADRRPVFWSYSEDEERLTHESPEEALVGYFDDNVLLVDVPEAIKKEGPVKVYGWARKVIDWDTRQAAEYAVERENEDLAEEYGDPDGDEDVISGDARETLVREIAEAFDRALARSESWRCEIVETKTYTPEEAEAALRAEVPEWFEVSRG